MVEFAKPIEIGTAPKLYKPARQCIYCGRHATKLTQEHIIPYGLAADSLKLPAASCERCAEKTKQFETICLRHMWWPFRTKIGAPSRGKEKPESFLMRSIKVREVKADGTLDYEHGTTTSVSPERFPLIYVAFTFPAPAVLVDRDPSAPVDYAIWAAHNPDEMKALGLKDKEGFRIAPGEPEAFSRLLAKIAHAYAAAELGLDALEPALARYIMGNPMPALKWIGGDTIVQPPRPVLHDIRWRIQQVGAINYVVVDLRLFSFLGSPQYHVVVGELKRPLDQLPFLKQPLYTIDIQPPLPSGELMPFGDAIRGTWT